MQIIHWNTGFYLLLKTKAMIFIKTNTLIFSIMKKKIYIIVHYLLYVNVDIINELKVWIWLLFLITDFEILHLLTFEEFI